MEKNNCQIMDRIHKKGNRKDIHGPGRDLKGNKLLVLTMRGQISGTWCPMQQRRKQNKDELSKNQSSTVPDS